MKIEQTIRRILREELFNESIKDKLENLLDKKGLGETLNVLRIDIDKLSSMMGISMEELIKKYNPFKDIFTDEEFKTELKNKISHIEVRPILKKGFKEKTLEKKIDMVLSMIIDEFHSDLINWDVEPYDWKVPQTPELLTNIYKDSILNNDTFKRLSSVKNSKLNENNEPKINPKNKEELEKIKKLLAYQKLINRVIDGIRYQCEELNSDSEEIISFDACDFIDSLTEMKIVDITIDGTIQVILKYDSIRYIDFDLFIYEFKHEMKKYGNVKIDVIDSINIKDRQW